MARSVGTNLRVNAYQSVKTDHFQLSYDQFWEGYRRLFASSQLVSFSEPVVRAVLGQSPVFSPCGSHSIRFTPQGQVIPCVYWPNRSLTIQDVPRQEDGQPVKGGDLITVRTFENFELYLEWKISRAGNSGIKYNVSEEMSTSHPPDHAALGFEYQILDDEEHPDAKAGANRTAGALYDLIAPTGKRLKPVGEYNAARIVFSGNHGEHWLNGIKVLEYDLETPEMESRFASSKYRVYTRFSEKRKGHIVLQDHGDVVWYRNIKIREIKQNEVLN